MTGFIYAIQAGDLVKIGFSKNPRRRLHNISVCSAVPCRLLGVKPGTEADESALHIRFGSYRVRGEWFENEGEVTEFIASLDSDRPLNDDAHPITAYLSQSGESITQLAVRAQTTRQTIHRLIRGEQKPSHELMARIMAATNGAVQPNDFFADAPQQVAS